MSTSMPCNIEPVLSFIAQCVFQKIDPSTINFDKLKEGKGIPLPEVRILDVGMGFGKWGFLVRDTFDVLVGQTFQKKDWKIHLTGVDIFKKNITSLQQGIYNDITEGDILKVIDNLKKFDLVILGDVIEHFEKKEGLFLLDKLFEHTQNIIVSTPLGFSPQGAWAGNEREVHRSGWMLQDFKKNLIINHTIVEDQVFSKLYEQMENVPNDWNKKIKLLVLWLRKKS